MTYRIIHKTAYRYKRSVPIAEHAACLRPRSFLHQRCIRHELLIQPSAEVIEWTDYFGNRRSRFTIQEPHRELLVEARSEVSLDESEFQPSATSSMPWEDVARHLSESHEAESLDAYQFTHDSPRIGLLDRVGAAYARSSFTQGRPFVEALRDLSGRIHREFHFDSSSTDVYTSVDEVFRKRRGVCQDFAHLTIAALRSLDLAARYVSGYLNTNPAPGVSSPAGSNVSHAWISAYCPGVGWIDVDPTNNAIPDGNYITIGWGRDYSDVSPLRGVILGDPEHSLTVTVDVTPIDRTTDETVQDLA